jgi:hypothetical protein
MTLVLHYRLVSSGDPLLPSLRARLLLLVFRLVDEQFEWIGVVVIAFFEPIHASARVR